MVSPGAEIIHGWSTLTRSFSDEKFKFGGTFKEDLDRNFDMYEGIEAACGVTDHDKRLGIKFMLRDHAAHLFIEHDRSCRDI